jgi:Domain of unknown function (DUF4145)
MQLIPEDCVSAWVTDGPRCSPSLVDWMCPHCPRHVSFLATGWRKLEGPNWHGVAKCPGCHAPVQLFALHVGTGHNTLAGGKLFMYPAGRSRVPAAEVLDSTKLTSGVKSAYKSAVNVTNTREWTASAVLCRRLLEGIAKSVLPPEVQKLPLAKQLAALPDHVNLAKPVLELADTVRRGGNLGAHFDLDKEPDEQVARLMLDLCEDLLQYLFVLPQRIDDLHTKIEALGNAPPPP